MSLPEPPSPRVVTDVPRLPRRPAESNKGTYGKVLVVAGCRDMPGAAVLCGSSALRGGAGLVTVAVPDIIGPIIAAGNPCLMVRSCKHDESGQFGGSPEELIALATGWADVIALGPGLGPPPRSTSLVGPLLTQVEKPIVLDADGLNAIAADPSILRQRSTPTVLTPHPGEFGRLVHQPTAVVQADRPGLAARFAREFGVVLVLKGHHTLVTDGQRLYRNLTGNPGMATAGSGDVLTGLIAALIGQKLEPFDAAVLGTWVHGRAGDLTAADLGEVSLIASDLLDYLPRAIRERVG